MRIETRSYHSVYDVDRETRHPYQCEQFDSVQEAEEFCAAGDGKFMGLKTPDETSFLAWINARYAADCMTYARLQAGPGQEGSQWLRCHCRRRCR